MGKLDKPWLGVQIEGDPELPRKPVGSVMFALKAGVAGGIDCSGCIGAQQLDPQAFAGFAKLTDLGDFAKATDLNGYAKTSALAKVALTGKAEDLIGAAAIDLTGYAKTKDLANVALTGKYADLTGAPTFGKSCGTGLVVTGIDANGGLQCTPALDPKALPADTLDKISAGVLSNFIQTKVASTGLPKDIPDNNPVGVGDVLDVGDIGNVLAVSVHVVVANSDFTKLKITLQDPAGVVYTLTESNPAKLKLDTSWPNPTPVAKGDRSRMNVTFFLKDDSLNASFLEGAQAQGMVQLRGHRSAGGMRASIYNAMPFESVQKLVNYMHQFEKDQA